MLWMNGDMLSEVAFVSGKLTVGIDLAFERVENAWTCSDGFKIWVADTNKEAAIGLKPIAYRLSITFATVAEIELSPERPFKFVRTTESIADFVRKEEKDDKSR